MATELVLSREEKVKLNNAIVECANSLVRAEGESEFRKDVANRMKEELNYPTADFNLLVKERYAEKSTKALEKHQETVDLNEELVSIGRNVTTQNP